MGRRRVVALVPAAAAGAGAAGVGGGADAAPAAKRRRREQREPGVPGSERARAKEEQRLFPHHLQGAEHQAGYLWPLLRDALSGDGRAAAVGDAAPWRVTAARVAVPPSHDAARLHGFIAGEAAGTAKAAYASLPPGAPVALVVCPSAARCCEVLRLLTPHFRHGTGAVFKLFAKHMDIKTQVECLRKFRVAVGVGTPERVLELFRQGALSPERCQLLVVDMHRDAKMFSVLDHAQLRVAVAGLAERLLPQDHAPRIAMY